MFNMAKETGADRAAKRLKEKLKRNAEDDAARAANGHKLAFTRQMRTKGEIALKKHNELSPAEFGRRKMAAIRKGRNKTEKEKS